MSYLENAIKNGTIKVIKSERITKEEYMKEMSLDVIKADKAKRKK